MADLKSNASMIKLESDMANYIKILGDLIKRVELDSNDFQAQAPVVKRLIREFEAFFTEKKSNKEQVWQQCLSELSPSITKTYLRLVQTFHQYDPHYTQEFYGHWKLVLQQINGTIRANSFISHIDEFKFVIQHLRTAEQRLEQFAILSVLTLYIESVPTDELFRLAENDNFQIVHKLILLKNNHSLLNRHEFLYEINAMGHCIQSVKPQKVICKKLKMHFDSSEYKMWLDFNKKDNSIVLLCISLSDSAKQTVAISGPVKMRGNVHDHHLLEINGVWYVITDDDDPSHEKITVKVYLSDRMEDSISKSTRNCFRFVKPSEGGPGSRGFQTGNELEPLTDDNLENTQQEQADEHIDSVLPPNIIAEPQLQRYDSSMSLPVKPKPIQNLENLNLSCPVLAAKKTNDKATAERISMDPNSSVNPIVPINDTGLVGERPGGMNTTYVVRQSVDPIVHKQSENDRAHEQDNYDEISMDIEHPPIDPSNQNESAATYIISRPANFTLNANSGITIRRKMSVNGDDKCHEAENGGHVQNGWSEPEREDEPNARLDRKTIRVLEDVIIVPPRAQIERAISPTVPIEQLRQEGSIRFLHYSQADESFTVSRNGASNIYSQPTTRLEKLYIKNSSHQLRSSSPPITVERNEMSDESPDSIQNTRKRATNSVEQNATQKKCRNSARSMALSSQKSQLTPVVGSLPIGTSSQSQYELFAPVTTSSQKLPVKPLLQKTLNSQTTNLSPDSAEPSSQSANMTNPTIELSSHSRRTPQETTKMPTKKSQSVSMSRSNGTGGILRAKYSESTTRNASVKAAALHPQHNETIITFDPPEEQNAARRAKNISQSRTKMPEASPVVTTGYASQKVTKAVASQNHKNNSETLQAIDPVGISQQTKKTSQNRTTVQEKPPVTEPVIASQKARNSSQKRSELLGASSVILPSSATQKATNSLQNRKTILETPPIVESMASQNREITFEPPEAIVPACTSQETRKTSQNRTTMQERPPVTKPVTVSQKAKNSTQNRSEIPRAAPVANRNNFSKKRSTRNAARHTGNIFKKVASKASNSGTRYSSLKRTKKAVTRPSSSIEAPNNDSIHVDDSGMVYDDNVCVFADNYELQRATQFYIANDGLAYMKTKSFENLPAEKREKCERKLRTIHTMMNRGLERQQSSNKKICDLDPYRPTHEEFMLPVKKGKSKSRIRSTKQMSVTISTQQTDNSNKVTVSRRTSKLLYVVDKDASSKSMHRPTEKHKNEEKIKSMHRATMNEIFNFPKNVDGKTSGPSVNLTSETNEIQSKEPSPNRVLSVDPSPSVVECDQPMVAMNLDCAESKTKPKKLPIYASSKMKAKHQPNESSSMVQSNNTSKTAKRKFPIYASDKMMAAKRYQPSESGVSSTKNLNNQANGNGVDETEESSCTCGEYANEWLRRLNEMVSEPDQPCRGICKQRRRLVLKSIDRLQHIPTATDYFELFNGTLASMESTCNAAEEQFEGIQKPPKDGLD